MSTEPQKATGPENQERSEREATFSRRGLLQWSVPAILAVTLPGQVTAGTGHGDTHRDHGDTHDDLHEDGHLDQHTDLHKDSHDDHDNPFSRKGTVPSLTQPGQATPSTPGQSGSGIVPRYSTPGGTGGAPSANPTPGQGGSGIVPKYSSPKK